MLPPADMENYLLLCSHRCWWVCAVLLSSRPHPTVFLQSVRKIHRHTPHTNFMSPCQDVKYCTLQPPAMRVPLIDTQMTRLAELFKLRSAKGEVVQDKKHAITKLFIHSFFSLAEIFTASFAINVLQTASPCPWVLLYQKPCHPLLGTIPGHTHS